MDQLAAKISFNDSLLLCSRLGAFATARLRDLNGNLSIESVSEELAHRDTLNLALSLRRVSQIAGLKNDLQYCRVPELRPVLNGQYSNFLPLGKSIELHRLIGILIHCETFQFYKNSGKVQIHFGQVGNDAFENYNMILSGEHIDAVILVKSDKSNLLLFQLREFVVAALSFLEVAQVKLSDLDVNVGIFEDK